MCVTLGMCVTQNVLFCAKKSSDLSLLKGVVEFTGINEHCDIKERVPKSLSIRTR